MRAASTIRDLVVALALAGNAHAQLVLRPIETVERPPGTWTDTVLIAFDTQEPLGTLRRIDGMGEERAVHVVFEEHPATVVKRLLGPGVEALPGSRAHVLKVNRLRVDELGTRAVCLMHAEVLERSGEAYVRTFEGSVSVDSDRCGKKVDCHEHNIYKAVQEFLSNYQRAAKAHALERIEVHPSDLSLPFQVDPGNSPVLGETPLRRGLYRTFTQFRANAPDTLFAFDVRETLASTSDGDVIRLKHMPGPAVEQYWGLCDGTYAYVRVGRIFVRVRRSGSGFTALVPQPDSFDPSAVVLGGIFFGVVGGVIAGAASTDPNPPILCELNMLCGDLAPSDHRLHTKDFAANIFHVTRFAKDGSPISVTCDDLPTVLLGKGQWTSFELPPQAAMRNVLITGPKNSETISIATNSDKVRVYLITPKKDGTFTVSELNEQLRKGIIDELKPEDRRP